MTDRSTATPGDPGSVRPVSSAQRHHHHSAEGVLAGVGLVLLGVALHRIASDPRPIVSWILGDAGVLSIVGCWCMHRRARRGGGSRRDL